MLRAAACIVFVLLDVVAASLASISDIVSLTENAIEENDTSCRHGVWNDDRTHCDCFPGWRTAGFTDLLDWAEGVCEQFECTSDQQCIDLLSPHGIQHARCPVKGWNCYCGVGVYALSNGYRGFESMGNGGVECMGIVYASSVFFGEILLSAMTFYLPPVFLLLFLFLLPFGKKRLMCDHHRPSIPNAIRHCTGSAPECDGTCVQDPNRLDRLKDDFAWSFYVAEMAAWTYLFIITLYIILLSTWSVLFFFVLVLFVVCAVILIMVAACLACLSWCDQGVGLAMHECHLDCSYMTFCCDDCGTWLFPTSPADSIANSIFWGGPFPTDPFWGYSGYGRGTTLPQDSCCYSDGRCRIPCCIPVALLCFCFPSAPENAWGGLIGYWCGTRMGTPPENQYQGGNALVEFLGMWWRRRGDLHGEDGWRKTVRDFLYPPDALEHAEASRRQATQPRAQGYTLDMSSPTLSTVGAATVRRLNRPLSRRRDMCVESSFDDYANGECWICAQGCDEWDCWIQCRHIFCKECSSKMLNLSMPCPLCRVVSTSVLRGSAFEEDEVGDSSSDPLASVPRD